jgi:hypothetical protein
MLGIATEILLSEIQKHYSDDSFGESDLVSSIASLDLTHQLYLLMVLGSSFYSVEDQELLAQKSFSVLVEFHKKLQGKLNILREESNYEKQSKYSYVVYLDNCLRKSNETGERWVEDFKCTCESRRSDR